MKVVHEVLEDREMKFGYALDLDEQIFTDQYREGTCVDKIDTELII